MGSGSSPLVFYGKSWKIWLIRSCIGNLWREESKKEWNVISLKDSAVSRSIFSWRIWRVSNWKMMILVLVVDLEPCAVPHWLPINFCSCYNLEQQRRVARFIVTD